MTDMLLYMKHDSFSFCSKPPPLFCLKQYLKHGPCFLGCDQTPTGFSACISSKNDVFLPGLPACIILLGYC